MDLDGAALPERVGRYEVVLPIGGGRRSVVVLARATGLGGFDRYVALKLATPSLRTDEAYARALVEDAKRIANLRSNHVVPVYDVGEDEEQGVFLVTEYVPGDSLAGLRRLAREKGEPLAKPVELRILVDALGGLHAAHEHESDTGEPLEVVHRAFSPRSVLVGTDGIARVTDFGAVGGAGEEADDPYLAPEQRRGEPGDRRSDVWAAGVVAWEILTGEEARVWEGDPPRTKVTADLDEAVAGALRVDPEQRTKTAAAFAKELAAAARAAGILAEPEGVAELVGRLVGPELAKRRARLARSQEAGEGGTASEVRTIIGMAAPPPPSREKLPSLPEVPPAPVAVPDAPLTFLALKVELGDGAADRASETILGASSEQPASAVEEEPAVYRSPVAPPVPFWRRRKVVAGAAAGAGVLALVLLFALRGGRSEASGAGATASGSALAPERGAALRVVVTGTDGGVATATADPGARGLQVTLDPNALPPPPPPPTASMAQAQAAAPAHTAHAAPPAPREKRTWPKRGPRK